MTNYFLVMSVDEIFSRELYRTAKLKQPLVSSGVIRLCHYAITFPPLDTEGRNFPYRLGALRNIRA